MVERLQLELGRQGIIQPEREMVGLHFAVFAQIDTLEEEMPFNTVFSVVPSYL